MKKYCIICAHPDDETLFFTSILNHFGQDCFVQCLTDGNADNRGKQRKAEFESVMKYFGVKDYSFTGLADIYDRPLDTKELEKAIETTIGSMPQESHIFTHGPFGDYGHPHHIQVSRVVHKIALKTGIPIYYPNVLALNAGSNPFENESDSEETWSKKLEVLETIYLEEYRRFISLIPARARETFIQSDHTTLNILNFLSEDDPTKEIKGDLGLLSPFKRSLEIFKENGLKRKF